MAPSRSFIPLPGAELRPLSFIPSPLSLESRLDLVGMERPIYRGTYGRRNRRLESADRDDCRSSETTCRSPAARVAEGSRSGRSGRRPAPKRTGSQGRLTIAWRETSGPRRNLHTAQCFRPMAMAPELRDGRISVFAKRIMRKPRTLHCPYCDGKVLFTRNEEHLDAKNCPHCGMRVERREWPEKLYDPMPILRTKPGGPDSMKIETPETKDEGAKKGEKEKKD